MIVSMLAGLGHRLRHLLRAAGLAKSTYYHLLSHPAAVTRPDIEPMVAEIFARTPNGCGHRQIRMCLVHEFGVRVSHKSVLKVMRRMGLECRIRRPNPYRKYSSYRDETGARAENLLNRDFTADRPWVKLGTDVTEFRVADGKAYPAPVYDMGSKEIVAWDVSRHPDMAQQRRLLAMLEEKLPEDANPIPHSDMGWQYRHRWWRDRLAGLNIRQSMSRKGNCIDNAATEQVFGHLKDEFHAGREFASYEQFKNELDAYIIHWNTKRRQIRLEGPPRRNSGTCPSQPNQVPLINHVQQSGRSSGIPVRTFSCSWLPSLRGSQSKVTAYFILRSRGSADSLAPVMRYTSNTPSILRTAASNELRCCGSAISKLNWLVATRSEPVAIVPEMMFTPWSESTRVTSESRFRRSSAST